MCVIKSIIMLYKKTKVMLIRGIVLLFQANVPFIYLCIKYDLYGTVYQIILTIFYLRKILISLPRYDQKNPVFVS